MEEKSNRLCAQIHFQEFWNLEAHLSMGCQTTQPMEVCMRQASHTFDSVSNRIIYEFPMKDM